MCLLLSLRHTTATARVSRAQISNQKIAPSEVEDEHFASEFFTSHIISHGVAGTVPLCTVYSCMATIRTMLHEGCFSFCPEAHHALPPSLKRFFGTRSANTVSAKWSSSVLADLSLIAPGPVVSCCKWGSHLFNSLETFLLHIHGTHTYR